jgi:PAS domain S-box-containing protein
MTATPDFRTLFESAPGSFLVLEPDPPRLTVLAVSDAYLMATMTRREEIVGRGLFEVFPDNPDDPEATGTSNLAASLGRVIATRQPDAMAVQKYDIRRPESEGGGFEERWWSPVNSPVLDDAGELRYIIHRVEDVSELVRLEKTSIEYQAEIYRRGQQIQRANYDLRRANRELRARVDNLIDRELADQAAYLSDARASGIVAIAADAIISVDAEQRITGFNRGAEAIFGYLASEALGRPLDMLIPERFRAAHRRHVARFAAGGESSRPMGQREAEIVGLRKCGEDFHADAAISKLEVAGVPVLTVALRDISERVRHEGELERQVDERTAFIEGAIDTMALYDAELRLVYMNPAGLARLGRGRLADVAGKRIEELEAGVEDTERYAAYREVVATGHSALIHETANGDQITDVRAFPVGDGVGVIATDVTERATLAAQLRQAQKLEAIGTLAAGVAHDFNNLLMGVRGCAERAAIDLAAGSEAHTYLEEIRRATASGASITRQLLAFSRKRPVEHTHLALDEVIADQQRMLGRLLGEDIELVVELGGGEARVRADRGQLEQIVLNLCVNARDAIPGGGRIDVVTRIAGGTVVLEVSDTGTGMSAETRERIFEPFFTTKGLDRGTGLGLSTVYGIVTASGGAIDVQSREGRGTRFVVELPIAEGVGPEPAAIAAPVVRSGRSAAVLVVEDEPLVRATIRHYLESAGHRVIEAASGADASRRVHPGIDVVVTDMVLPDRGGQEIAREIAGRHPGIGVIYMSAHAAEQLVARALLEPGIAVLQKPFEPEVLLERIEVVIAARPRPRAVLVVEDNSSARMAIEGHLEDLGWTVLGAASGAEAIELAGDAEISALLTDYSLPDMTGDEIARLLRSRRPDIRVIYMSGYSELEVDPPGPVLVKPLDLDVIAETLEG